MITTRPHLRLVVVLCALVGLLAACAPPAPDRDADTRALPTQPPPPWTDSVEPVTLDNIARIRYLGRLDSPSTPSTIFAHSLSPDGTRLAGLDNEQLVAWDLITGEVVFTTARGGALQVYYAPDKTEVYTLNAEGTVTIYNASSGISQTSLRAIEHYDDVHAFYDEDGWLAFGSRRGEVRVWDPLERQSLATISAHPQQVVALAFSPDGDLLATAGEEGIVRVWHWRSRELRHTLPDNPGVMTMRFSPDARQLAVGTREHTRLWSLADNALMRIVDTGPGGVEALAYSPDGRYLVNGGSPPEMSVWDPQTGALIARLPDVGRDRVSLAFSPDGDLLVTSVLGGPATVWNMTTLTQTTVNRADLRTEGAVFAVNWTSDSRLLTLFGASGGVYIWGIGPDA
jgi:WD40 repeat protein